MNNNTTIQKIEEHLKKIIGNDDNFFIVEIQHVQGNKFVVLIDNDKGINIDELATINRKLYTALDEDELFKNLNFSLEISSPGLDEPLKLKRQYKKNINRNIEITTLENEKFSGILKSSDEEKIVVELTKTKNKKQEVATREFLFTEIKKGIIKPKI